MIMSPFPYMGGKHRLAGKIVDYMPDHLIYAEVVASNTFKSTTSTGERRLSGTTPKRPCFTSTRPTSPRHGAMANTNTR